jgi:hypothetical protein
MFEIEEGENIVRVEIENPKTFYSFSDPHYYYEYRNLRVDKWIAYKETPKGYWIVPNYHFFETFVDPCNRKWILKDRHYVRRRKKRFAYETPEEALYSYYRRKLRHIEHLEQKHFQLKKIIRDIEQNENVFGALRPRASEMRWLNEMRESELKPLRIKRPVNDFINESEFTL